MNHFFSNRMMFSALAIVALFVCARSTQATDIAGTITSTLTIYDDSRLVDDVHCAVPIMSAPSACIVFGAPHIELSLNGHTITGSVANPPTGCSLPSDTNFEVGIWTNGQTDVEIEGPGVIQQFQRWGILLTSSTHVSIKRVTANRNCWSGLQLIGTSDSSFKENVWANNAAGSNGAACGGICLVSSNNNAIRKSTFYGNGSVDYTNGNVDFGVGLEGTSSGNRIEKNDMGGNTNGVLVFATASDNVIRHNIIVGNPPGQVSKTFTASNQAGADIHDRHTTSGANTFKDNFCLTYSGPTGVTPCPNIRKGDEEKGSGEEERDEARNRLTSPLDSQKESSGASTIARRVQTVSAIASVLAIAFGRFVGSVPGL